MGKALDLTGKRYGKLVAIKKTPKRKNNQIVWEWQCDCGTVTEKPYGNIKRGYTLSCGCLTEELGMTRNKVHGHWSGDKPTREYNSWQCMKQRCSNPKATDYENYGGRGISVCNRWLDSFENFLKDMGERPEEMTLDRINPDGNYEPKNCRWADAKTQSKNKREVTV